jgi:hypothetical protein
MKGIVHSADANKRLLQDGKKTVRRGPRSFSRGEN